MRASSGNVKKPQKTSNPPRSKSVVKEAPQPTKVVESKAEPTVAKPVVEEVKPTQVAHDEVVKPKLKKLSTGRIVSMVITGLITSALIAGIVWGLYYNLIRYPDMGEYNVESSGLGAIHTWVDSINTVDNETIKAVTGEDSYIAKELDYANDKDYHIEFIKKVIGTVSYTPNKVEALDKYGNILVNEDNQVVYTDSLVNEEGEKVVVSYIDYTNIPLDKKVIKSLMKEENLSLGDVDYSRKLIKVFCKYIVSLEGDNLPLVSVNRAPNLVKTGEGYAITADEDIYLDKELFSSDAFYSLLNRFSKVAGGNDLKPTKEWKKWDNLSKKKKSGTKEPEKYSSLDLISSNWCGSYYLLNEFAVTDENGNVIKRPVSAEVGDGTLNNPAGLDTDIITSIFIENSNGKRVKYPIRVRLKDFRVSQSAIDYFEGKDERNRGFDIKSEVQYASYTFEITNLSDKTITVYDDSSLSDKSANMAHRTGIIYGLQDKVKLAPQETGVIESWGNSTELNKKYLVWGDSFNRETDVVWFRVLAGNIDDPSEDKGVTLNKSRYNSEEEE